jgi:hypothetical protein
MAACFSANSGTLNRFVPLHLKSSDEDAEIHYQDLTRVYNPPAWNLKDLANVLIYWRLWRLVLMYSGVVGVGIGTQFYGTVIISGINSNFTGTILSLLFAPILGGEWKTSYRRL